MSLRTASMNLLNTLLKNHNTYKYVQRWAHSNLVIECKRKKYNFKKGQSVSSKFEEVVLASKGWTHSKSQGDYFTVHADLSARDHPSVPWEELDINPALMEVLDRNGAVLATKFQSEAIPTIRSGMHALVAAETGCGKTYAYLIPLMQKLVNEKPEELNTPRLLILIPNRELAHQVGAVATELAKTLDLTVKVTVGGRTKRMMMNPEFSSVDVLIGTPGAIGKLSSMGIYKLNRVQHTVLDEADTLLDDSFMDRMESIMRRVSQSQIVLVSATVPKKLPAFLEPIMNSLVQIQSDRVHKPLLNINQKFIRLIKSAKPSNLLLLAHRVKNPMIIFTNRNETCNWLAMFLRENGVNCANINGDMNFAIRIEQWNRFSKGDVNILSATDIGSRGLDTTQVNHILNYDFPLHAADYIHRVGRIGRLGSVDTCKVTNFVTSPLEIKLVQNIEMAIRTDGEIQNVDGNITHIVQRKILSKMRNSG